MDTLGTWGNKVKIFGDSRSAGGTTTSTSQNYIEVGSYFGWAFAQCNGVVEMDPNANYAVSGDDTSELISLRLANILADDAHIAIGMIGVNDRAAGISLQDSKDNILYILTQLTTASAEHPNGHRVYLLDEMPNENLSGSEETDHKAYRDYIRGLNIPNVFIVNVWDLVSATPDANLFVAGYTTEYDDTGVSGTGLHPNAIGNAAAAPALAAKLIATISPSFAFELASTNATGVLNSNPDMSGTAGSNISSGISTGSVADDFVGQSQSATGVLLTMSKDTVDGVECQKIVFSGIPTTDNALMWFYNNVSRAVSGYEIAEGESYNAGAMIKYEGFTNMSGANLECQSASPTRKSRSLDGFGYQRLIPANSNGWMFHRAPDCEFPTGATTSRVDFLMQAGKGNTVGITSITQAAGVATVTTPAAHGLTTGDKATIVSANQAGYNLTNFTVTVTSTTTFTYLVDSGTVSPATGSPRLTPKVSITRSGSTATVTTLTDHRLKVGDTAVLASFDQAEYNGSFTVQSRISSTQFTITVTGTPATPATGAGTVDYPIAGTMWVKDVTARKSPKYRITENGNRRVTEDGNPRITQGV